MEDADTGVGVAQVHLQLVPRSQLTLRGALQGCAFSSPDDFFEELWRPAGNDVPAHDLRHVPRHGHSQLLSALAQFSRDLVGNLQVNVRHRTANLPHWEWARQRRIIHEVA